MVIFPPRVCGRRFRFQISTCIGRSYRSSNASFQIPTPEDCWPCRPDWQPERRSDNSRFRKCFCIFQRTASFFILRRQGRSRSSIISLFRLRRLTALEAPLKPGLGGASPVRLYRRDSFFSSFIRLLFFRRRHGTIVIYRRTMTVAVSKKATKKQTWKFDGQKRRFTREIKNLEISMGNYGI